MKVRIIKVRVLRNRNAAIADVTSWVYVCPCCNIHGVRSNWPLAYSAALTHLRTYHTPVYDGRPA